MDYINAGLILFIVVAILVSLVVGITSLRVFDLRLARRARFRGRPRIT